MDCCSRTNHGFHVARHVVRTTVDVQRECGDPFVIPEMTCPGSAITHTGANTRDVPLITSLTVRTSCSQSLASGPQTKHFRSCLLSSFLSGSLCLGSWPFAFHFPFPFGMSFALVTLAVSFAFALAFGLASSFEHFSKNNIKCASRFPRLPRPHVTVDRKAYFLVVCANVFRTQSKMVLQLWWRLINQSAALTVCRCTLHRNQNCSDTGRAQGSSQQCHLPASVRGPVLWVNCCEIRNKLESPLIGSSYFSTIEARWTSQVPRIPDHHGPSDTSLNRITAPLT